MMCMPVLTCVNASAGIVESSSRRMGNRSKTLLKKGQCLGERAILEGEPAAESCSAGSPVLALIVNRYTRPTLLWACIALPGTTPRPPPLLNPHQNDVSTMPRALCHFQGSSSWGHCRVTVVELCYPAEALLFASTSQASRSHTKHIAGTCLVMTYDRKT